MHFLVEFHATSLTVYGSLNKDPLPEAINQELTQEFKYSTREWVPPSRFNKTDKGKYITKSVFVYDPARHVLPWGLYDQLHKVLSRYGEVTIVDVGHNQSGGLVRPLTYEKYEGIRTVGSDTIAPLVVDNKKQLRPYQQEAVAYGIANRYGHICLPTGAGKTEVYLNIIEQERPKYSLIVVFGTNLVEQTVKAVRSRFPRANVKRWDGKITAKQKETACLMEDNLMNIIVCSYESYNNYKQSPLIDKISHVFLDEIQKIPCATYAPVVDTTPYAYLRLGFTATPFRDDNATMNVIGYCGRAVYSKSMKELVDAGYLARPIIKQANLLTPEGLWWLIQRSKKHKVVCFHEHNQAGVELTAYSLTELCSALPDPQQGYDFIESLLIASRQDRKADAIIKKFTEQPTGCILVTPIMDVGVDIPDIDTIVLMQVRGTHTGALVQNIQRIGRGTRVPVGVKNKDVLVVVNLPHHVTRSNSDGTGEVSYPIQPPRPCQLYRELTQNKRAYAEFDHGDFFLFDDEGQVTYEANNS